MTKDTTDGTTLDAQTAAEFIECANNDGEPIDWRGWVGNRPKLTAGEAARLMAGLNPHLHKSLVIGFNEPAGAAKTSAREFEEWAASQDMERASPAQWLAWGERQGETVHIGFRLAVEQYALESAPAAEAATIAGPGTAAPVWQAKAREIAQSHWDKHKAMDLQGTLDSYAEHVEAELRRLKITGPRGEFLSAGTIKREALQSAQWWRKRKL